MGYRSSAWMSFDFNSVPFGKMWLSLNLSVYCPVTNQVAAFIAGVRDSNTLNCSRRIKIRNRVSIFSSIYLMIERFWPVNVLNTIKKWVNNQCWYD